MDSIVGLESGMSLVFSPGSFLIAYEGRARKLGASWVKMKTGLRIGNDGGQSKMATIGKKDQFVSHKLVNGEPEGVRTGSPTGA